MSALAPAGSTAAKVLAEKGLHVLLVERHKLPRYKSCSGVLIQKTMDLVRRYFGEDVPLSATCTPVENRGMIFTDDKGRVLFAGEIAGFLNPMGEGISAGMESGCCVAHAIARHFDSLDMIYADYQRDTQQLKSYMERQWNFVGRMAGTFSEMVI